MPTGHRVSKTHQALRDLAEIAAYYGEESLELELRFLNAAEEAFEGFLVMPEKGARRDYFHPTLQDLRFRPIPTFPAILIYYRPQADGVEVIRVLHSSRDIERQFLALGEGVDPAVEPGG